MEKLTLAVLIIGTFVVYSFVYRQSSGVALVPTSTVDSGNVASRVTPTSAGASSVPPTSTVESAAGVPTVTPGTTDPTAAATTAPATQAHPTAAPLPTTPPAPTPTPSGNFKDGSYVGTVADAQWGYLQVKVVVSQGRLTDVQFLQYPHDRSRSAYINSIADPMLKNEALQVQSAQVDIISGATDSSEAFVQSLSDALQKAQA